MLDKLNSIINSDVPSRYTESHTITLVKTPGRRLDEGTIKTQLETMIAKTMTGARVGRGWSASIVEREIDETNEWDMSRVKPISPTRTFYRYEYVPESSYAGHFEYHADIRIDLDADRKRDSVEAELLGIVSSIHANGQYPKWSVSHLDAAPHTVKPAGFQSGASISNDSVRSVVIGGNMRGDSADAIGYAPIAVPQKWDDYFTNLYGLSDQIGLAKSALVSATSTAWAKRFHTKLIGPPGCGKSELLRCMKRAVGEEAVMEFDATATTAAGAMEMLSEFEELPRVLVVEELEKAPTDTFQFLLGLMDDRSEIRKVTARKKIFRETKLLVFATINDEAKLNNAMDGALSSRFSNPIYFNRPSRDLLARILQREIDAYGGAEEWIEPVLDLADTLAISDPRRIIAMCMLGRDELLSGEYQRRLMTVGLPHKDDMDEDPDNLKSRLERLVKRIQDGAA